MNRSPIDANREASIIARIREAYPDVQGIYLYGSVVRGDERRDSDLDIAILRPRGAPVDPGGWLSLVGDLSLLAGRDVDFAHLSLRSVVHAVEVVARGRRIATFDVRAVAEFEMQAFSSYARLREDRAPIERAYTVKSG